MTQEVEAAHFRIRAFQDRCLGTYKPGEKISAADADEFIRLLIDALRVQDEVLKCASDALTAMSAMKH